jgi:hypothetical protein
VPVPSIAKVTGLTVREGADLVSAVTAVFGFVGMEGYSPEEILGAGQALVFDSADRGTVDWLLRSLPQPNDLRRAFDRRALATATLPSLTTFDISVDLRLSFDKEDITDGVAVALAHIDTDAGNRELWFQLTRGDLDMMIETLTDSRQQMDAAEKLFQDRKGR